MSEEPDNPEHPLPETTPPPQSNTPERPIRRKATFIESLSYVYCVTHDIPYPRGGECPRCL